MRGRLATTFLTAAISATATAPAAAAPPPTRRQIARAVSTAEHSKSLWATVNICNSRRHPDVLGVRGQMPTLGFSAQLTMRIQLNYWSTTAKAFKPITSPNAVATRRLGSLTTGLQQDGAEFRFGKTATGLYNATVTFTWTRSGKVLGRVKRTTTAKHHDADFGSPPHYSAAKCLIR